MQRRALLVPSALALCVGFACDNSRPSLYIPPGPSPAYAPAPFLSRPAVYAPGDETAVAPDTDGALTLQPATTYQARVNLEHAPSGCRVRMTSTWTPAPAVKDCPPQEQVAVFSWEFTTPGTEGSSHHLAFVAENDGAPFAETGVDVRIRSRVTRPETEFGLVSLRRAADGPFVDVNEDDSFTLDPETAYVANLWLRYPPAPCVVSMTPSWTLRAVDQPCRGDTEAGINLSFSFTTGRSGPAGLRFVGLVGRSEFGIVDVSLRVR